MSDLELALACLPQINPAMCSYEEWTGVGMALKDVGASMSDWDGWSSRDSKRYHRGEIAAKWNSFRGHCAGKPVTVATMVKLCRDHGGAVEYHGVSSDPGHELDWDAEIGPGGSAPAAKKMAEHQVVRQEWLQEEELPPAPGDKWNGMADFATYIRTLFQGEERVGIVTECYEKEADENGKRRWLPRRGCWDRTAEQLLVSTTTATDLGAVVGDWNETAGAWIRFNPLDGEGCSDTNVTSYRFALVESDSISIERQYTIYRKLELPIACLVHSGGKSLHAIVRIEAATFADYQKRVDFLYDVCKKNGLQIDRQNRNPSRLSRLPGVTRETGRQWLVATNIGKSTWKEWEEWIAAVNDDLPDVENLATIWNNMPPLATPIIDGLLRCGHKMLLAGPSKAGKSFSLLQLAIAIAEGREWIGWPCRQGRVLYVNLELDRPSALNRLKEVYAAMGIPPNNMANIDVWNLRGKALPMTELAPKLIRRAIKTKLTAVIIDPIYKVITGDENAADQMAKFCNLFDRVCGELGAAVIYCHHHSKGDQGQKRASDRASGSGVFARDPDALVDLIELVIDDNRRKQISNRWQCKLLAGELELAMPNWADECPDGDDKKADKLAEFATGIIGLDNVANARAAAIKAAESATGWRIEGILREFAGFSPRRMFFRYPIHQMDTDELLADALADGEEPPKRTRQEANISRGIDMINDTLEAYNQVKESGQPVTVMAMAKLMRNAKTGVLGIDPKNARLRIDEAGFGRCKRTGNVTELPETEQA